MDFEAVREREKEVSALWKPRHQETKRIPCYDCVSDFIYEHEPNLTVQHIRDGRYGWEEPDKTMPLCEMHLRIRQLGEEKYSLARLDRLQIAVANWGRLIFPDSNVGTISDHLAEEMIELLGMDRVQEAVRRAIDERERQPADNPAEESADILLLLLHLADRLNFNLMESTLKKFHEIEDAEWEDDGRGYKKRVKPDVVQSRAVTRLVRQNSGSAGAGGTSTGILQAAESIGRLRERLREISAVCEVCNGTGTTWMTTNGDDRIPVPCESCGSQVLASAPLSKKAAEEESF